MHTFDSHRWRFSKGKQWKCLICLLFCRLNAIPRRQNVRWVLWEWNSCKYFMPLKVVASRNVIGRFRKLLKLIGRIAQVTFRTKTLYGFFLGPVIDLLFRYNTTMAISCQIHSFQISPEKCWIRVKKKIEEQNYTLFLLMFVVIWWAVGLELLCSVITDNLNFWPNDSFHWKFFVFFFGIIFI